ncbi:MAG: hypothetical protein KF802_13930 [Bdellovibrionaceae bacterium]|nr:hypothetical protein [Pseudobdellovibrionaceae bacterium]MBX3033127.1 hypothetical protein [Pseudobdellovibrionaceae bacterium]
MNFLWGWKAEAQSRGGFSQRATQRESSRWTLQEWLEQRDRSRMMDLWLSMNSPSPFEFMLGLSYLSTTTKVDTPAFEKSFNHAGAEVRAYAQFVGLTAEYENNAEENYHDFTGMLNLRLFGNSLQNSSLTLHGGQRSRGLVVNGTAATLRNVFVQGSLQLYFSKYFGLDGFYRHYSPDKNADLGVTVDGNLSEVGLFIDFQAVRVFGAWYQDVQKNKNDTTGAESATSRTGVKSGLRIYY